MKLDLDKIQVMNKLLLIAFLFVIGTALSQRPRIQFEFYELNADTVVSGPPVYFIFPFLNTGNDTLIISTQKMSSGNFIPQKRSSDYLPIPPGGRDTIVGVYKTSYGGSDKGLVGPIRKTITVCTNDTTQPHPVLLVRGYVVSKSNGAELTFEYKEQKIERMQGESCIYSFPFCNTGNEPLIISNYTSSCGCLVPYGAPKEPVFPGQCDTLYAQYDSSRLGPVNKTLTVTSNAINEPSSVLSVKGTISAHPSFFMFVDSVCSRDVVFDAYNHGELCRTKDSVFNVYVENISDSVRSFSFVENRAECTFAVDGASVETGEAIRLDPHQNVLISIRVGRRKDWGSRFAIQYENGTYFFEELVRP
jgi:hypothetical protein